MPSPGFADSLELRPGRSAGLRRMLWVLHALALVILPLAMRRGPAMLVLAGAIGASWWFSRRHPAFGAGRRSLDRLIWHADGRWTVYAAGQRHDDARLRGDSLIRGPILILRFDSAASAALIGSRILFGDELEAETMRRLRARLSIV